MQYRAIIREAWALTQENKRLMWWFAIVPAMLTTLVSMVYLAYQGAAFWSSPYIRAAAEGQDDAFSYLVKRGIEMLSNHPGLGAFVIVVLAIIGLAYLMLPVFTQGALIQLVWRLRSKQEVSAADGISYGLSSFLPMFEYHLMLKSFSWVSIVTNAAFILRSLGPQTFLIFSWIFALFLLVGLVFTLLFTFAEFYIVLENRSVFKSILKSSGLVVRQWHHMLFMILLMAIISVRIIFNIVAALIIPFLILLPIFFFASLTLAVIGVIVGAIVGLVALYFASYFLGVFHVFATAVWAFTFMELTAKEASEVQAAKDEDEESEENAEA